MDGTRAYSSQILGALAILGFAIFASMAVTPLESEFLIVGRDSQIPISVTGILSVVVRDDFDNRHSENVYLLRDERTGTAFKLHFEDDAVPPMRSGLRVTARGHAYQSTIYVAASGGTALTIESPVATPSASATSSHSAIVIVANFRDAAVTCSLQSITDMMFSDPSGRSAAALYRDCSLSNVLLSGDVVGPYSLDAASTDPCDFNAWSAAADAQAAAAGVNVSVYQHKFYVFPQSQCGAAGYGTVGGSPSSAWIFQCGIRGVYAHEFGHNLGFDHASTPSSEYDDFTDPMALSTGLLPGVNAPHRQQLGWYGPAAVQLVDRDGAYDVAPLALDFALATAPQILMIRKPDTAEYYYLSYRLPIGFDAQIDGSLFERVSIHRYRGDGSSVRTYRLAGLADGETFVDQANGIGVAMVSHDSTHASVSITLGCVATLPFLSFSPASLSGVPGATADFSVTVKNLDAPSCPVASFALGSRVPQGWSGVVSPATATLEPGATAQATVSIASSPSTASGTYAVSVSLSDALEPMHASSAGGTFTIVPPTDAVPPTTPTGLNASPSQKLKQIRVSWIASSDNIAVSGYRVWRNGIAVGLTTEVSWNDSNVTAGQTYTYAVQAYDAAGNISPRSDSVSSALSGKRK